MAQDVPVGESPKPKVIAAKRVAREQHPGATEGHSKRAAATAPRVLSGKRLAGSAMTRFQLSTQDVVQVNHHCSEWGGFTGAVLVTKPSRLAPSRVIDLPAGAMRELRNHLLIFEHLSVGSDGSGEPAQPPKGADDVVHEGNGNYAVTRLAALDLRTMKLRHTPWDVFSPLVAGAGRFILFAQSVGAGESRVHMRRPAALFRWDLATGNIQKLGELGGTLPHRIVGDEVFARVHRLGKPQDLALNGTTGRVRLITPTQAGELAPSSLWLDEHLTLTLDGRETWMVAGRAVKLAGPNGPTTPSTRSCGLGPYWSHDRLFVDEGVYAWPKELARPLPSATEPAK